MLPFFSFLCEGPTNRSIRSSASVSLSETFRGNASVSLEVKPPVNKVPFFGPKQQFVTKELLWGKMRGFCVDSCDNYEKRSFPEWHLRIGREPHISMKVDLKLVLPSVAQRSSVA